MVLPASRSRFRKRFSSRNSLLRISSLSWASHVSWRLWISRARRSFCSWVSLSTHAFLSNFWVAVGPPMEEKALVVVIDEGGCGSMALDGGEDLGSSLLSVLVDRGEELGGLGAPKKEFRVACSLGFLDDEVSTSAALRLTGVAMFADNLLNRFGLWKESISLGVTRRFIRGFELWARPPVT